MSQLLYVRISAASAILSSLLFIISIVGMQYYLGASLENVSSFIQNMIDHHGMMLMYGWPGLAATLLIIPLVDFIRMSNTKTKELSNVVFIITLIGLCFVMVGYLFHLALTYFHAPMYIRLVGESKESFAYLFTSTIGLQDMFWLSGDLFSFLGIALLLAFNFKEGILPKWVSFWGILGGLMAAFGSVSFVPAFKSQIWLSLIFISGFSLFAIWEIIAAFYIIKSSKYRIQ